MAAKGWLLNKSVPYRGFLILVAFHQDEDAWETAAMEPTELAILRHPENEYWSENYPDAIALGKKMVDQEFRHIESEFPECFAQYFQLSVCS